MRNPKYSDPEMKALRVASRNLSNMQRKLQRAMAAELQPLKDAADDAAIAVSEACDAVPGLLLDDINCCWMRPDEGGQMVKVEVGEPPNDVQDTALITSPPEPE